MLAWLRQLQHPTAILSLPDCRQVAKEIALHLVTSDWQCRSASTSRFAETEIMSLASPPVAMEAEMLRRE
jgi:hypothetical protein